jgi:DNA invertase Pin-like site-specific DNA recombinase
MNAPDPKPEVEKQIVRILCASRKPVPLTEIAEACKVSRDELHHHLERVGKARTIRIINAGSDLAVGLADGLGGVGSADKL